MEWEWTTVVTVTRNLTSNFYRTGLDEIDEAEIFDGADHKLTMEQMYTWEFQCKYQLTPRYNTLVQHKLSPICLIKSTDGALRVAHCCAIFLFNLGGFI